MRTEHLRALLKAAQLGSISKASRALHINQQQLSKTILALENDFGCKIFERSAKGIRPTAEGEDILATAERMLSDLDALTARLAQKAAQTPAAQLGGTLTIHTMVNIWPHSQLFEALDAFTSAYPAVKILYDELSPSQIIAAVVQHPEQIGSIVREQTNFGTTMTLPVQMPADGAGRSRQRLCPETSEHIAQSLDQRAHGGISSRCQCSACHRLYVCSLRRLSAEIFRGQSHGFL